MKNKLVFALFSLLLILNIKAQDTLFYENFGNSTGVFEGTATDYGSFYSSTRWPAISFINDSISIYSFDPADYENTSGTRFLWIGTLSSGSKDRTKFEFSGINTSGHYSNRISLGSTSWAFTPDKYLEIYYSTDGTSWTLLDNTSIYSGAWPDGALWGYVTLSDTLPQTTNLHLRFINMDVNQTVRVDDILIQGHLPDPIPPSQPTNLSFYKLTSYGCVLGWNESTDNIGVYNYEVLKNGISLGVNTEPYFEVEHQTPGESHDFSVIAHDFAGNSSLSAVINISFPVETNPDGPQYIWNEDMASILPNGDLQWMPKSFTYNPGSSIRYIDFEAGDDNSDGLSTSSAWKHHPWDPNATGNSLSNSGIHTYVFKRGVVYRGTLSAKESGTPIEYIQLTSDPAWGTGEAMFYGSEKIEGGWTQCDSASAPKMPEPNKIWYIDLAPGTPETKMVVENIGGDFKKIKLARSPNWEITDSLIPLSEWWKWTGVFNNETVKNGGYYVDESNLTQGEVDYWKGGTLWSEYSGTMGTVWGMKIESFDPVNHRIYTKDNYTFGGIDRRYYIENLPQLLDTTNEYWFDKSGTFPNRLYIRLDGDKSPNVANIEVATKEKLIEIHNKHYISISGISFGQNTFNKTRFSDGDYIGMASVINTSGYCHHITIKNCKFKHVNAGIMIENGGGFGITTNNFTISDNDFRHVHDQCITARDPDGKYFEDFYVLRNRIYQTGTRQLCRWYSAIEAINLDLTRGVIAGNFIDYCWGSGVNVHWGKSMTDDYREIPLIRGLVYQNRVENSLLGTADWGGIEHWQGGPAYYYNNYSKNGHGWRGGQDNVDWDPWGFPFYFDGSFKLYAFNNIAVSPFNSLSDPSQRNRAGYQMVIGNADMIVNNTSHNFYKGLISQALNDGVPGYNAYLGNIFNKTSHTFVEQSNTPLDHIKTNWYANNIFAGDASRYWRSIDGSYNTFEDFQSRLTELKAQCSQLGWEATQEVLQDAANNNFLPAQSGEAIDRGVKFFAPWSLSKIVGEWHFYKNFDDSTVVLGENIYMTDEYLHRDQYHTIPKNNLTVLGVDSSSFVYGLLEDWTEGALVFNGSTYCSVSNSSAPQQLKCHDLDMFSNNFIIELYFKTEVNHNNSVLISKVANTTNGYELGIDESGNIIFSLIVGGSPSISLTSLNAINDGVWHHVLAEVSRTSSVNIYIDGSISNGALVGSMPDEGISLENNEDFYIGKSYENNDFFKGTIDFVRISKGDLNDAKTTISELYKWEFNGPFLRDFAGNQPIGKRDAGALEAGGKSCDLSVSASSLDFGVEGGDQFVEITAPEGFELIQSKEEFISTVSNGNTLTISVEPNIETLDRSGSVKVFGCNETINIYINQKSPSKVYGSDLKNIMVYPNPANNTLTIAHNYEKPVEISLFNIYGQKILQKEITSNIENIDISTFNAGVYLIVSRINNNESVIRIIKE